MRNLSLCVLMVCLAAPAYSEVIVKSRQSATRPWKAYSTRTLEDVKGFKPVAAPVALDKFGGLLQGEKQKARGFFRVQKIADRWWLITPEGNRFIHVAICSVTPETGSAGAKAAMAQKFGSIDKWALATAAVVKENGFNGTGSWSNDKAFGDAGAPLVYTQNLNLMSSFGSSKKITVQKPGHAGYPNDCIPVFHPEFPAHCEKVAAAKAAPLKNDPYLLGWFSDNEMPLPNIEKYLKLDANDPVMGVCQKAAADWVAARGKKDAKFTPEDREAWVEFVLSKYFEITTAAIRKADPNHLCIGSRFHGADKKQPACWRAAGKFLDVVSVNYYGVWTPDQKEMKGWEAASGKPFMVTEWYTKGEDSGMANTTGAGWNVPTQKDRGLFYQNYCLALLESKVCVGWHWFKYQDNDPENLKTDPSNRDSNKGIVNNRFEPYAPLLLAMKGFNVNVYPLISHLDAGR